MRRVDKIKRTLGILLAQAVMCQILTACQSSSADVERTESKIQDEVASSESSETASSVSDETVESSRLSKDTQSDIVGYDENGIPIHKRYVDDDGVTVEVTHIDELSEQDRSAYEYRKSTNDIETSPCDYDINIYEKDEPILRVDQTDLIGKGTIDGAWLPNKSIRVLKIKFKGQTISLNETRFNDIVDKFGQMGFSLEPDMTLESEVPSWGVTLSIYNDNESSIVLSGNAEGYPNRKVKEVIVNNIDIGNPQNVDSLVVPGYQQGDTIQDYVDRNGDPVQVDTTEYGKIYKYTVGTLNHSDVIWEIYLQSMSDDGKIDNISIKTVGFHRYVDNTGLE